MAEPKQNHPAAEDEIRDVAADVAGLRAERFDLPVLLSEIGKFTLT